MSVRKLGVALVVASVGMLVFAGCSLVMPQTVGSEFQGGSSPLQVADKLAKDSLNSFNADDVQMLAQLAEEQTGEDIPEITDAQAAAVVQFIADNNITTMASLQTVIEQAETDPDSIVISEDVAAVIESLGMDSSEFNVTAGKIVTSY